MIISSYKINPKHRSKRPSNTASIWTVSESTEIMLFATAAKKEWKMKNQNILWSINSDKIGRDVSHHLYIAKFPSDHNNEWHGYPVYPRNQDVPPENVLQAWFEDGKIDKTTRQRIKTGKFKS